MLKNIIITGFLICFAFSVNGQIATPQLDAGFHTLGGAATGWRYGSIVSLVGISTEGKAKLDGEEVGDVISGMNAEGPKDSNSPIPFLTAAYKGESLSAEWYGNIADGLKTDVEMKVDTADIEYKIEEKEQRINLAYVIGESISVGLGYYSVNNTFYEKETSSGTVKEKTQDITDVGTNITTSVRLADVFYVAIGYEMVTQTGTNESKDSTSDTKADILENSWSNTMWAVAVILGEPEATQLRAEYGQIISPESVEKTDSGDTTKQSSYHIQTTTSFASAEIKFGSFILGYNSEVEKQAEFNDESRVVEQTSYGVGWQPSEGLTLSLYTLDSSTKVTSDSRPDQEYNGSGFRFFLGYNF